MAQSQPLNSTVNVYRRVRGQRNMQRHDSIKNITHKLRTLILQPPHQEIRTQVVSRDTSVTDFSTYMGQAKGVATRGHPIVIGTVARKNFNVVNNMTGLDFPVKIGSDKFVQLVSGSATRDLHQDARDAT